MDMHTQSAAQNRPWNTPWNIRKSVHARRKPDGGFCFIPAMALLRAWWAYKQGIIRLYDLRVWFACFEVVARRCNVTPNRFPRYRMEELHPVVGGTNPGNVKTAVVRLSKSGLLNWSERRIEFPAELSRVDAGLDPEFDRMVELVANHRRKVPVPRRTLRFLAGVSRPVMIATVLGHLLRCVYYRNGHCVPDGRCKASWVAETFSVDVRNVKAARLFLGEIKWLVVEDSSQTALNRWGAAVRVNLVWNDEGGWGENGSPPPAPSIRRQSPPPRKNWKLSSRVDHQKPAFAVRPGVRSIDAPTLCRICVTDLHDSDRLDVLWRQAHADRRIGRGENDRLRFHAAAAHALRVGTRNQSGLFATIVRRGLWHHLTGGDEDAARRRLAGLNELIGSGRRNAASQTVEIPTPTRSIIEGLLATISSLGHRDSGRPRESHIDQLR